MVGSSPKSVTAWWSSSAVHAFGDRGMKLSVSRALSLAFSVALLAVGLGGSLPALASHVSVCEHDGTHPIELTEPIELCQQVVLEGDQTGFVRVKAPEDFGFRPGTGPGGGVSLDGDGTVGFLLTQDPPSLEGTFAFRLKYPPALAGSIPYTSFGCGSSCLLPAGNYRLYLITSGAPAKVTLRLTGELQGAAELPPMHFPDSETKLLPARLPEVPTRAVNSAGETGQLTSSGLIFSAIAAFHPNQASAILGGCLYHGDPGDPQIAYLPGCPSPSADVETPVFPDPTVSLGPAGQRLEGFSRLPAGTYGVGTWYAAASTDSSAASLVIWLEYS